MAEASSRIDLDKVNREITAIGLDNESLAEEFGVTREHVSQLRTGKVALKYKYLKIIAELTDRELKYFYKDYTPPEEEKQPMQYSPMAAFKSIDSQGLPFDIRKRLMMAELQIRMERIKLKEERLSMFLDKAFELSESNLEKLRNL